MINNEKVSLMTKLAIYEEKNSEDIKLSKYYKSDYIRHNVLKTIISVSFAYVCVLLLILFYNLEEVLAKAFELNYTMLGIEIFVSYFVLIVIFTLISFMIYSEKINRSRKSLMKYHRGLKQLIRIYDEESYLLSIKYIVP